MLILFPEDVKYCEFTHPTSTSVNNLKVLKYHGHSFIKIKSYAHNQLQNAISYCRELLEDRSSVRLPILLKEPTAYSLWFETRSRNIVEAKPCNLDSQKPTVNNKVKTTLKYRGVEIVRETKQPSLSHDRNTHNLKYRGQDYSQ